MSEEYLDGDGYPTDAAFEAIEKWCYNDPHGWFKFIESLWYLRDWGWRCKQFAELDDNDRVEYHISTAGWSGNESIIRAMEGNHILWCRHWVQSRRGGHYIFEVKSKS